MKKWDHGYVVGGVDEEGVPFLLGSFDSKKLALRRFQEAMASDSWVAEYQDSLYVARLVEERIQGCEK